MVKLSIIIPYYNANRWIGRMLDSLLNQDMPADDYEIIVVDDGSTEKAEVLNSYAHQHSNIKIVRQENSGPGAARNTGLTLAMGEYVLFCDSDDFVAEKCLSLMCHVAHKRRLDMLFFNVLKVNSSLRSRSANRVFNQLEEFASGQDFFSLPIEGNQRSMGVWQFII